LKIYISTIIGYIVLISIIIMPFHQTSLYFDEENVQSNQYITTFSIDDRIIPTPDISKFQMMFPPGVTIGTFDQYSEKYPYSSASFQTISLPYYEMSNTAFTFGILVDAFLYPSIISELDVYINDLQIDGYQVILETVQGGSPESIKQWLIEQYQQGIQGFIFIGDIPAAWVEVSASVFPCDLFYMDLDGQWADENSDGIYEAHTSGSGDMHPEIYIGRLFASSLAWDAEETMIKEYFNKVHLYRKGVLTAPWRGVEYVEEDWYDMDIYLSEVYDQNISRYDFGFSTNSTDYLSKLAQQHHYMQVCAHSYPGGHYFSTRPTQAVSYAHVYVYSPSDRDAKILLGVDDGIKVWVNQECVFEKDKYNGWYQRDQYRVDIHLNQGWNQLLCKVSQEGWDYKFSVQITDASYHSFPDLIYQSGHPDDVEAAQSFIRSWLVNGFHQDSADYFYDYLYTNYLDVNEASIEPIEGEEMGGCSWTLYESGSPIINLEALNRDVDYGCSYAYVKVISDEQKSCQLSLGYDDGVRCWLNGEEIFCDNRYGDLVVDMATIDVVLQPGENHLLVKVSEWMGNHGFCAYFQNQNGSKVKGLRYEPVQKPVSYIGNWLIHGVYENEDETSRLSIDYLDGESIIIPKKNMTTGNALWDVGIGDGAPFDLGLFFDKGGWVFSETIQQADPPVLFYNLFSCGPGRFTDENYLAGSYIFNTTYGLITVASAKSGSMLNFFDYYEPLGNGASIGVAFQSWFDAQAPFELWEKEWYYGLTICGDPTLTLHPGDANFFDIHITHPENGLFFNNTRLFPFFVPLVFGDITCTADVIHQGSTSSSVSWFVDGKNIVNDTSAPFQFEYTTTSFGRKTISVVATDTQGFTCSDEIKIWKFF